MDARMKNPAAVIPGAWQAIQALHATTGKGGVPESTLALVHLRVSQINGCSSRVRSGSQTASKAGESDERLSATAAWRDAPFFTDAERAAPALAEAVTRLNDRPDEIWDGAARHYDKRGLAALVLMIATTNLFNPRGADRTRRRHDHGKLWYPGLPEVSVIMAGPRRPGSGPNSGRGQRVARCPPRTSLVVSGGRPAGRAVVGRLPRSARPGRGWTFPLSRSRGESWQAGRWSTWVRRAKWRAAAGQTEPRLRSGSRVVRARVRLELLLARTHHHARNDSMSESTAWISVRSSGSAARLSASARSCSSRLSRQAARIASRMT
jgi:AhpD family alkylhydroperoxidase